MDCDLQYLDNLIAIGRGEAKACLHASSRLEEFVIRGHHTLKVLLLSLTSLIFSRNDIVLPALSISHTGCQLPS